MLFDLPYRKFKAPRYIDIVYSEFDFVLVCKVRGIQNVSAHVLL